jgi:rfaE bifunctional protein nucleotidyltransferase chain/domain
MQTIQPQDKIITDLSALVQLCNSWKANNQRIVFTNGCFDILHKGHIDYLYKASNLGDKMIVAINSDASVSALKGIHRPIQDEDSRAFIMASLGCVDAVIIFNEDTPLNLIESILPNILVKGGDYTISTIVGAKEVIAHGGEVKVIPFLDGYSTTAIETKIKLELN